jgi:hypothetical protein
MQLIKALGFAGALILAAIVGGTVIGSALATDETDQTDATDGASQYCDTFMESMASELAVTREALVAAGQVAAGSALDAAVAAGDLSEERATEIRERIAEADGDGCRWFGHGFGRGPGPGMARGFLGGDVFEAVADALGIESADLFGELRDAESLEALAEERGVGYDEVKASVLAAVQADLDAAVDEGMDQGRADSVIERLTAWLDGGGQLDEGRFRPGHWRERGSEGA